MLVNVVGRIVVGLLRLGAVSATVIAAYQTRSEFAEVNPIGGVFIVAGCAIGVALAVSFIRVLPVLVVTAVIATVLSSLIASSVLNDDSSTAAIGVIGPPLIGGLIARLGIGVSAAIEARQARTR